MIESEKLETITLLFEEEEGFIPRFLSFLSENDLKVIVPLIPLPSFPFTWLAFEAIVEAAPLQDALD
jgi:hypothetical protein